MKCFFFAIISVLSFSSYAGTPLTPKLVNQLMGANLLKDIKVNVSKKFVAHYEKTHVDATSVTTTDIVRNVEREKVKQILDSSAIGLVTGTDYGGAWVYVSFDKDCFEINCSYRFVIKNAKSRKYTLMAFPLLEGYSLNGVKFGINKKKNSTDLIYTLDRKAIVGKISNYERRDLPKLEINEGINRSVLTKLIKTKQRVEGH